MTIEEELRQAMTEGMKSLPPLLRYDVFEDKHISPEELFDVLLARGNIMEEMIYRLARELDNRPIRPSLDG